jgi:hypothetical protein
LLRVQTHLTLADYIARGDENTQRLLASDHPVVPLVNAYYRFFAEELWAEDQGQTDTAMFLGLNAFTLWTGAVRIALSGHEAATYPILRTALESACYALLVNRKPELAAIWSARHDGEAQRKASRKAFGSAVADVAAILEAQQPSLGDFLTDVYDAHIDSGAHPNPRGVTDHFHPIESNDDKHHVGLGSLYPGNSFQVFRALTMVTESARAIAMALTACLPAMPQAVADAVRALEAQHAALSGDAEPVT